MYPLPQEELAFKRQGNVPSHPGLLFPSALFMLQSHYAVSDFNNVSH